jgi:hypothetical protein
VAINRKSHSLTITGYGHRRFANSYNPSYPAGLFYFGNALTGLPGEAAHEKRESVSR